MPGLIGLNEALFTQVDDRRADVMLYSLDEKDDSIGKAPLAFQYFPESMTDTKAINYQQKEIPGGSLPLYQWIASGERLISFTAQFTSDVNIIDQPEIMQGPDKRRNVDVRSALLWLRRHLVPHYGRAASTPGDQVVFSDRTYAPAKIRLHIPNSGIGLLGGGRSDASVSKDAITCLMTQCEITYQAWFPNGLPQIAEVQLAFAETPQINGRIYFPGRTAEIDDIVEGNDTLSADNDHFFSYNIQPRVLPK